MAVWRRGLPTAPNRSGVCWPVLEVLSFIDEDGECHLYGACVYELPDPGDVLRDALGTPEHYG